MQACIDAGLPISGTNAEVMLGQWEFQVGPVGPLVVGDQLWLARWLLYRIAEDFGVAATLDPKPVRATGTAPVPTPTSRPRPCARATTRSSRRARRSARRPRSTSRTTAPASSDRLTGLHETAPWNEFSYGVSDRGASVRIPWQVEVDKKGYIEDRRPNANMRPVRRHPADHRHVLLGPRREVVAPLIAGDRPRGRRRRWERARRRLLGASLRVCRVAVRRATTFVRPHDRTSEAACPVSVQSRRKGAAVEERTPAEVVAARQRRGGRDRRPPLLRPARADAALLHARVAAHRGHVRGRLRLRRVVDPRVPGDPGVGHDPDARSRHRGDRPVPPAQDARTCNCFVHDPVTGESYSRDPRYVAQKAEELPALDRHRRHLLLRARGRVLHLRRRALRARTPTRRSTRSTRSRRRGTPAATRARTSATSPATRRATSRSRRWTTTRTCARR